MEPDLIDADFSLHVLQPLLDDGDEGSRGHQSSINVGLADVAFYAKGERRVGEAWKRVSIIERAGWRSRFNKAETLCSNDSFLTLSLGRVAFTRLLQVSINQEVDLITAYAHF